MVTGPQIHTAAHLISFCNWHIEEFSVRFGRLYPLGLKGCNLFSVLLVFIMGTPHHPFGDG